MKKGLGTGIILAIFVVGLYFHLVGDKRGEGARDMVVRKSKVPVPGRGGKSLSSSPGKAKRTKNTVSPFWMKNRLAMVKAIRRERDDFERLEVVSDSVATWRISQKYLGIHKNNFVQGTPFVAKIGRYYIVEKEEGEDANIVYRVGKAGMGVVNASLMVKVRDDSDVESLLEGWERDENLEIGLTFLHIGVVELKTRPGENIARIAKELERQEGVERVKIDVIEEDTLPW